MAGARSPNPIDIHVGKRVKERRVAMKLSQEKLGEALGVTFQQVQKYEKGTNRISASRMQAISKTLGAPIGYFYEGAPVDGSFTQNATLHGAFADAADQSPLLDDVLAGPEGTRLNRAFMRIENLDVRRRVVDLVCAIADAQPSSER